MMKRQFLTLGLTLSIPFLTACDTVRNGLGLDHYQPDEFAVPDNPPLSIPQDYKLRPPRPGAKPSHAVEANIKAQRAMGIEQKVAKSQEMANSSERQLIAKVSGETKADPAIREVVNRESAEDEALSESLMGKIRSWKKQATNNVDPTNKPLKAVSKVDVMVEQKTNSEKQDSRVQDAATTAGSAQQGILKPVSKDPAE